MVTTPPPKSSASQGSTPVATRSKSGKGDSANGGGKGGGRGCNDRSKKAGGRGNRGGGKWKKNKNNRSGQDAGSAELSAAEIATKAKEAAKAEADAATKAEKKKVKEIDDAKMKAIRLRTEMATKERNATESARKWNEAKEKLLTAEATAAGISVEEMREVREAEHAGITLGQLREKKASTATTNQGGVDEVEVIGVIKGGSEHNKEMNSYAEAARSHTLKVQRVSNEEGVGIAAEDQAGSEYSPQRINGTNKRSYYLPSTRGEPVENLSSESDFEGEDDEGVKTMEAKRLFKERDEEALTDDQRYFAPGGEGRRPPFGPNRRRNEQLQWRKLLKLRQLLIHAHQRSRPLIARKKFH